MMQAPNAQGLAGLLSQGRAPQQPQQQMPSPMKASPMASLGSVEDRVAAYRGNPAPLQQRYAMSQDLLDLLALQKIKSEKEAATRQMQMQMAQQQAQQGEGAMTVAQQREKEVMDMTKNELAQQRGETAQQQTEQQQANMQKLMSGIARAPGAQAVAQPKMMAEGGIVAFAGPEGSVVPDVSTGPALDAARQRRRAATEALQKFGLRQRQQNPEGFQAAQAELRAAEAALADAQKAYEATMSAAGLDRPPRTRQDMGAAGRYQSAEPFPVSPQPEVRTGPVVSDVYPDETKRGTAAGLASLPAAGPARPAAPAAPPVRATPMSETITATPRPPSSGPATPTPPTMDAVSMIPGLKESIQADVARDPEAAQRAQEDRIRKMFELTPEQRAVYEQGIAQRQKMFEEQYDPERQRREGLKQFLIGAGGRRYGEFGAGAGAGIAYDEGQRAQRLKDFEAMQKSREGLVGLEREGIKPAIEGGLKGLEAASGLRRQGQASGSNIFGTESQSASSRYSADTSRYGTDVQARTADLNRQVEMAKVKAQEAANAVAREGLDFSRMQGHLNTVVTNRARAVEAVQKRFGPQMSMLEMQLQAAPNDRKLLDQRNALNLQIEAEVDKVTKDFDEAKAMIESRLYGRSGAGTGGYTVRKRENTR
jgi:hypothetical protein